VGARLYKIMEGGCVIYICNEEIKRKSGGATKGNTSSEKPPFPFLLGPPDLVKSSKNTDSSVVS